MVYSLALYPFNIATNTKDILDFHLSSAMQYLYSFTVVVSLPGRVEIRTLDMLLGYWDMMHSYNVTWTSQHIFHITDFIN